MKWQSIVVSEADKILEEIDIRIQQAVSENKRLKSLLEDKDREIESLQKQVYDTVMQNRELKENKNISNLTNILNNCSDVSESKLIINDLLRKINKSISIISKDNDG
ncbi:MAG: hypothetical protein J6P44_08065 [Bacteroidales bacterium]|nr:hypothetical protein [Bacteroidales bacterium]